MRYEMNIGDNRLVIVGTGHVFKRSVMEVKSTIIKENPNIVCVELDKERYRAIMEGDKASFMDLVRHRGIKTAILGSILSSIQEEVGEDYGVMPGADMVTAVETALELGSKIYFIDRNINITVSRLVEKMSLWEKIKTVSGAFLSLTPLKRSVSVSQFDESFINDLLRDFKKFSPNAYTVLIDERNEHMFNIIRKLLYIQDEPVNLVIVIGAGHIKGLVSMLEEERNAYKREKEDAFETDVPGEGDDNNWEIWSN